MVAKRAIINAIIILLIMSFSSCGETSQNTESATTQTTQPQTTTTHVETTTTITTTIDPKELEYDEWKTGFDNAITNLNKIEKKYNYDAQDFKLETSTDGTYLHITHTSELSKYKDGYGYGMVYKEILLTVGVKESIIDRIDSLISSAKTSSITEYDGILRVDFSYENTYGGLINERNITDLYLEIEK